MLKDDDSVLDLSALLAKLDTITSAVTGILVNATVQTGDIEIGAVELKNATTDDRAKVGTAGADAVSNSQNQLEVGSRMSGFNGTTWDRIRTAVTTISSTLTGFLNTLPWAIYNTTPTVRTNGQGGPLQSNANGDLNSTLNTYLRGEDPTFNVLKTQVRGTYTVPLTASGLVFTGPGQLLGFIVNSCAATATLKIWDNTSAATTVVMDTMTFTLAEAQGPKVFMLPAAVQLNTGCYFTIAVAAMSVTPIWNQS